MKNILKATIISLIALTFSACAHTNLEQSVARLYDWPVHKVVDGDTIEFSVNFLPKELKPILSVRLNGIDTPEKKPRAKCAKEAEHANKATAFTKDVVSTAKSVKVKVMSWDKYGGRLIGDVIVDGQALSTLLLKNGLAREYHGEAKTSWCN